MNSNHTRYAVTKINEDGYRVLACANRGQYHFLNRVEAQTFLDNILKNNSEDMLRSVYGDTTKMRVDPIECYHHGDAIGIYIKD